MNDTNKMVLAAVVALFMLTIIGVSCTVSAANEMAGHEAAIEAQYNQNRNNYGNYYAKLTEAAQVPEMYRDDLMKVYGSAVEGRYGKDGAKQVVLFIQEHNPNLDPRMYLEIQHIIEAGRDKFEADQKLLLDRKRAYEVALNTFPKGGLARILGYPKKDLTKYDIITDDRTEKAFSDKKADPIKLRP